jgi:hypothetical protein
VAKPRDIPTGDKPEITGKAIEALQSVGRRAVGYVYEVVPTLRPLPKKKQGPIVSALVRATKRELDISPPHFAILKSRSAHPHSGGKQANAEPLEEYRLLQDQLRSYSSQVLSLTPQETPTPEDRGLILYRLAIWEQLVYEVGRLRQHLARNLAVHFQGRIGDERTQVRALRETYAKIVRVMENAFKIMTRAKRKKKALRSILSGKEGVETLMSITDAVSTGSKAVGAVMVQIDQAVGTLDETHQLIERAFAEIAEHAVMLHIQFESLREGEGYSRLEEILQDLRSTVEALKQSLGRIREFEEARVRADSVCAMPLFKLLMSD